MSKSLQILYHGHCFDGALSAAVFSRFYRQHIDGDAAMTYRPMTHQQGDPFGPDYEETFFADDNAIVDFRYCPSERLTWWCDHHHSAFMQPEHRAQFEREAAATSKQKHFDPTAPSCTGLLARWLQQTYQFDVAPLSELVQWADIIDSARFESPAQAVELKEPALQLMTFCEAMPDAKIMTRVIETVRDQGLAAAIALPNVKEKIAALCQQQEATIALYRKRIDLKNGVAFFDLTQDAVDGFSKFVPYYIASGIRYTVAVNRAPNRSKISVGSNPWQRPDPLTNLADLCGQYGGGGHAVVAGVSMPPEEIERARQAANEIAAVLRAS